MKKECLKKSDFWLIFSITIGTIIWHTIQRFTEREEELPPISFHVAWNVLSILLCVSLIAVYCKFVQKKSKTSSTQASAKLSLHLDGFVMISELPTWAQNAIRENRDKEGSIFNLSCGHDRLSILGGFSSTFNGKKVIEDMVEIGPETTVNFTDLPQAVQDAIRETGRDGALSLRIEEGQLLVSNGKAYYNKKLVIYKH